MAVLAVSEVLHQLLSVVMGISHCLHLGNTQGFRMREPEGGGLGFRMREPEGRGISGSNALANIFSGTHRGGMPLEDSLIGT